MKVFISWSGDASERVAKVLREWLPTVVYGVKPFMSAEDIEKGTRGLSVIEGELEASRCGIICLTPENLEKPWINFEAGAISRSVPDNPTNRVIPFLHGLALSALSGPLTQFQVTLPHEEDVRKMVQSINNANPDEPMKPELLDKVFAKWWPELEDSLGKIGHMSASKRTKAEDPEILEKILDGVLALQRSTNLLATTPEMNRRLTLSSHVFHLHVVADTEDAVTSLAAEISALHPAGKTRVRQLDSYSIPDRDDQVVGYIEVRLSSSIAPNSRESVRQNILRLAERTGGINEASFRKRDITLLQA